MLASLMESVVVLLTFGLSSPVLSAVVCGASLLKVGLHMWYVDRFIQLYPSRDRDVPRSQVLVLLDNACVGLWKVPSLSVWSAVHVSSLFWALLLFDMVGGDKTTSDVVSAGGAMGCLWVLIVVVSAPLLGRLWLVLYGWGCGSSGISMMGVESTGNSAVSNPLMKNLHGVNDLMHDGDVDDEDRRSSLSMVSLA